MSVSKCLTLLKSVCVCEFINNKDMFVIWKLDKSA
jgi:hypothetical protein